MHFARLNPFNYATEDFGEIDIYAATYMVQTGQPNNSKRGGNYVPNLKMKLVDTIKANSTYNAVGQGNETWHGYQYNINHRETNWMKMVVHIKPPKEGHLGTSVAIDNVMIYDNQCAPMNITTCNPREVKTPMWGRMPTGQWGCSNGINIGSKCKLKCRPSFQFPRFYNGLRTFNEIECTRNGWNPYPHYQPCEMRHCNYPGNDLNNLLTSVK